MYVCMYVFVVLFICVSTYHMYIFSMEVLSVCVCLHVYIICIFFLRGVLSMGGFVHEGFCQRGFVPGGFCSGGF